MQTKRWIQPDNGKWWMTRKETEVLTDDTEWVVLDKGNEECIGQQQRQQRKRGESHKIMPMHGAMMLKTQETRNVFDERKGKGREKGNKKIFVRSWWCTRRWSREKGNSVLATERENDTKQTHGEPRTKRHPLQFKPCKTEWWRGTSTTQSSAWAHPSFWEKGTITKKMFKKHSVPLEEGKTDPLGKHSIAVSLVPTCNPKSESLTVGSEIQLLFFSSVARGRKTSKDSKQFTVTSSPPRIPTYHRSPNAVTVSPNVNSVRHAKPEPKPAQCKLDQSKKSSPETSSKQRQAPREACECGGGFLAWARTEPTKTCCSEEKNESRKQRLDDFILWRRCRFWLGTVRPQALARSKSPKWGLCHHENCWQSGIHQTAAGRLFQSAPAIE